ncbi:MAG TPA: hypothetical protein ENN09_05000, partial [Planctomycetes bacterium]|nr:hypothetical protein [Planctomycetota bacterium]
GIDVGEDRGYYYFAMEYIDGPNTRDIIEEKGPMAEKEALKILQGAARGLEHAWKNNILHRDIKPANLMLTSDGTVKLCDLGLATIRDPEAEASGSSVGKAVGTPYYISPEQARGDKDVDTRSDIYSLGATLYHMLSGHPPFEGHPAPVVLAKHLKDKVAPILSLRTDVSRNTALVLSKMMAKDRGHRHQTPTEVIEDMEDLLAGKPPRHSVRFRQESTMPLTAGPSRQTSRLATVGVRRVKVKQAKRSSAFGMLILLLLFMGLTAVIVWQISKGNVPLPWQVESQTVKPLPRPPDATGVVQPVEIPAQIPEKAPPMAAGGLTERKKALAEIEADVKSGRISAASARIRVNAFITGNPHHGLDNEIAAIEAEIARREEEKRALLASSIDNIGRLAAAAETAQAVTAYDTLLRGGFTEEEIAPAKEAIIALLKGALDDAEANIRRAIARKDLAGAEKILDEWKQRQGAAGERFPETVTRLKALEATIRRAETTIADEEREALVRLAEAVKEAARHLRAGRGVETIEPAGDMPPAYKQALVREARRLADTLETVTRKMVETENVSLPFRSTSISGKAAYIGPGRVRITTKQGMALPVMLLDVPGETFIVWAARAGITRPSAVIRFILFAGAEPLPATSGFAGEEDTEDLKLLIRASQAEKELETLRKLREKITALKSGAPAMADIEAMAAEVQMLRSAGAASRELDAIEAEVRRALFSRTAELLAARGRESAAGLALTYDTADSHCLGDWEGINGGWLWKSPGLEAHGGSLEHLLAWTPPLKASVLVERARGAVVIGIGGVEITLDAGATGARSADGTKLAEGSAPEAGRTTINIILDENGGSAEIGNAIK